MRSVLVECFREYCPKDFNQDAEEALQFIFDVLAKASSDSGNICPVILAAKNKLPHLYKTMAPGSFVDFFGAEACDDAV